MKKSFLILSVCLFTYPLFAQIGFGTNKPDPLSIIHLESTDKAFYLPRLTNAQIAAQSNWKVGMIEYNTDKNCLYQRNAIDWQCVDRATEPWFGDDDDAVATTNTEDIYHMGNVGIGVSDPGVYDLNVQGTGGVLWKNGNHEVEISTPGGHTGLIFNRNNLGNRSRFEMLNLTNTTVANRYFELSYEGENSLFLRQGGNVGVRNNAPSYNLDVNGSFRNTGHALLNVMNGSDDDVAGLNDASRKRGIYMWDSNSNNWGIYMSRPGVGRAMDGGEAKRVNSTLTS